MSFSFGNKLKITIFGQSHSEAIGVVVDGLPAGFEIDFEEVQHFMDRRKPGSSNISTPRKESDIPKVISGIVDTKTCGSPICAIIENTNIKSSDYNNLKSVPRPSHSDYPASVKYNAFNDTRGGGHFSGRLTAPMCFAGAVCLQFLESKGIFVGTHILSISEISDTKFDNVNVTREELKSIKQKPFPVINYKVETAMKEKILSAKSNGDSVGGRVECCVLGLKCGIGEPLFDSIESRLSSAMFSIPAVKGIEFGAGFDACQMLGSENNDEYYFDGDTVKTYTNNAGGIVGGLTTGMPVVFNVGFKPTPSIAKEQNSVNLEEKRNTKLSIVGRHDPCIVPRAVPCVEAMTAVTIADLLL